MKTLVIHLFLFLLFQQASGQVSGIVAEAGGQPVPFAGVSLLNSRDSSRVITVTCNDQGAFRLEQVSPGSYLVRVSMMGYASWYSARFEIPAAKPVDLGRIILQPINQQLNEVVIRADKPLVEQESGGLVVNVQSSILTKGSSVLQVLQRSPGVILNPRDNTISLNGKSDVMIMLDGKLMRMSMTQVTALLNGMSADNIGKIELLNTPPAKYDADGSAGLINIVTKKKKTPGTTGSFTATAGYGKGEKASTSVTIDHNEGKISLHAAYSYSHDRSYGELLAAGTENVPAIGGQTTFNYTGIGKPVSNDQNASAGIDVQLNAKTTLGGSIDYTPGHDDNAANNHGMYALRLDSVLLYNSFLNTASRSHNTTGNIYLDRDLGKGEKIHIDADYIAYANNSPTTVQSTFVNNKGEQAGQADSLYAPQQRDLSNTSIHVSVFKADYSKELNSKLKLETGTKETYTKSYSSSGIQNLVNGNWESSLGTSNNLGTTELITAAYATLDAQLDTNTNLTAGARYEYSHNSTDNTMGSQYNIDRKLGKLFPAVILIRKLDDHSGLQLSYTERISRPSYSDLASYVTYNDPVSVFTGNPALKPTITRNLKLGYNDHNYLFSLLFSRDDNPILQTQIMTGPTKGLVYLMPENASWQNNITLQATIPFKINDWWDMSYNFTGGYRQYRIDFMPMPFEKTFWAYTANFTETFKLAGSLSAEISGYYNSSLYSGNSSINGNTVLNAGIKKELDHNGGSFQLTVSDALRSSDYVSDVGILTQDAFRSRVHVIYNPESKSVPIIRLTYYRSFGSAGTKSQKKDENGSKEERSRL